MSRQRLDSPPNIGRLAQNRIGCELRAFYADQVQEPLPERILSALQVLEGHNTRLKKAGETIRPVKARWPKPLGYVARNVLGLANTLAK
jgi:hypothetical protein